LLGAVKSHLSGAELTACCTLNKDRVLEIGFRKALGAGFHQVKFLIFEASGRYSNLMLLDEEKKIVEAAKHIYPESNRYRSVLPGRPYVPPPPLAGIPIEEFSGEIGEIDRVAGIGKPLINAIKKNYAAQSALPPVSPLCPPDTFDPASAVFQKLGSYVTLFPYLLAGAREIDARSALDAARDCVITQILERHLGRVRKRASKRLEQMERVNGRKISELEALLNDESEAERFMLYGRLILANSWMIPERASDANLTEWTSDGEIIHRVELDPEKDASKNAERYFAKYKKKRAASLRAGRILPELYLERNYLREQAVLLECNSDPVSISMMMEELLPASVSAKGKTPKTQTPPHKRFEFERDGATLFVGLSARGNHYVTFKLASSDDIWLHAQNIPGAHVILRFKSKPDDESFYRMIEIAASASVYHSKARRSGRARVDYARRKYVRAITGAGLAQVTYREFSTIIADAELFRSQIE
jgi:predicted ribosome quality control (RQC) complex YloA/Tae2 family protein